MGGRLKREEMYVHMQLIHFVVQKKLIEHCKIIILQLKKKTTVGLSCRFSG